MRFSLPAFLTVLCVACTAGRQSADVVLHNAVIYTMNSAQPKAQALAVIEGRIVAIGSEAQIAQAYVGKTDIDANGQMVLPGFHDSHVHLVDGGIQLGQCNLDNLPSVEAITDKVAECNKESAGSGWLIGAGWNPGLFEQANPDKSLLDAISTQRPILLQGADGHSSWANSTALTMAGIARDTPNPHNGVIERDATSEASGTLRESAQELVRAAVPPLSAQVRLEGLRRGLKMANGFGITSVVEAAAGPDDVTAYRSLESNGELTARVVASIDATSAGADALMHPQDRGTNARLRTDSAKIFVDGVLEGETAALARTVSRPPGIQR